MELNVLNEKLNVDAGKVHQVNEYDFWLLYCKLLNIRNPILTDKDCTILANMLCMPINASLLNTVNIKHLEEVTKTQPANLFAKCKQLVEKGFLIKTEDGYFLHTSLQQFQKHVKGNNDINYKFVLPLKIDHNERTG